MVTSVSISLRSINPVAALTRLRNGALAEHEPSLALMTAAAREAHAIARRHGVAIPRQDWRARLQTVCRATAPNVNSMLADVLQGRRTEIDAINGAVVRLAAAHKTPVVVNRTLWSLIDQSVQRVELKDKSGERMGHRVVQFARHAQPLARGGQLFAHLGLFCQEQVRLLQAFLFGAVQVCQ